MQWWLIGAGLNGIMGVSLGALAAHGLNAIGSMAEADMVRTGANYQLWHAAALAGIGAWEQRNPSRLLALSGWLLGLGALAFGCAVYASALDWAEIVAQAAPFGGIAMILGWVLVFVCGISGGGRAR